MLGIRQIITPCCRNLIVIPATYKDKTVICPNCNKSFVAQETLLLPGPTEQTLLPAPTEGQTLIQPVQQCNSCSSLSVCPIQSQTICPLQARPVCPVLMEKAAKDVAEGLVALVVIIAIAVLITIAIVSG